MNDFVNIAVLTEAFTDLCKSSRSEDELKGHTADRYKFYAGVIVASYVFQNFKDVSKQS
jgi:hypothetical protein